MELTDIDLAFRKFQISKFDRKRMAAAVNMTIHVNVARALELRALKNAGPAEGRLKVSITHVILKAIAEALTEFPVMYSFFDGRKTIPNDEIALNVPVDVDNHVEYIVLRKPDAMNLEEMAAEAARQLEKIRAGEGDFRRQMLKLLMIPAGVRRWFSRNFNADIEFCKRFYGNCVVTNFGTLGVDEGVLGSAMPNPMISVICLGRVRPMAVEVDGAVALEPHMSISLTFDHRPVDGGTAARFLKRIRELLEEPEQLFNDQRSSGDEQ